MALPAPRGHRIPLDEAAAQTKRYRDGIQNGGMFLRDDVDSLLAQPGCSGIRYYYGRHEDGKDTLVLVAVDKDGNDLTEMVLEDGFLCPPFCSTRNALNA